MAESVKKHSRVLILAGCIAVLGTALLLYNQQRSTSVPEPLIRVVIAEGAQSANDILGPGSELAGLFEKYWYLRFNSQTSEAFAMEAPHFQMMIHEDYYGGVYKRTGLNELLEIEIRSVTSETEFLLVLNCVLRFRDSTGKLQEVNVNDRWVQVEGRWYHLIQDQFVFRQAT